MFGKALLRIINQQDIYYFTEQWKNKNIISTGFVITLKDLEAAMINVSLIGCSKPILEMRDMKLLAKK